MFEIASIPEMTLLSNCLSSCFANKTNQRHVIQASKGEIYSGKKYQIFLLFRRQKFLEELQMQAFIQMSEDAYKRCN